MLLNDEQRFKAIATRDRRFDGLFFVGVKTTGVYCRPGCPSKLPLRGNCVFFNHPAIAEAQGYRPCLRCRPELAPGQPLDDANDDLLRSAFVHIQAGALNNLNVASLAAKFGLSERHFRRLIFSRLGVSPVQLAQTQRLLLAKQLLSETNLPIIEVAFSSGFSSLRRFNDLFKKRYRIPPSALRKEHRNKRPVRANDRFICRLAYRPPFDWESLLAFFKSRQFTGVESVSDGAYSRTVRIGKASGWIVVRHRKQCSEVVVEFSSELVAVLSTVLSRVRCLLDLDAVPERINQSLGELSSGNPGLRVPGAFDCFEMAIRAILGQQISVKAATTLAARLVQKFGERFSLSGELTHFSPTAEIIAKASEPELIEIGVTRARAQSILALSRAIAQKRFSLDAPVSVKNVLVQLQSLPGIGEWTAQYLAMRALRWPDAFPASDLVLMKILKVSTPKQALALAEQWRPWRAYATLHLWRQASILQSC